ncbi:MAG TPA: hypothetical protein VM783_17160 [Candidatus Acidoferrum sp.]|nr:hypothetical protein [Candidatus Acidoferrum sp.]
MTIATTATGDELKIRESLLSESIIFLLTGYPRLNYLRYLSSLSGQPAPIDSNRMDM